MKYSPEKSNWMNDDIQYIFNNTIIEYDLKNAGITIIKNYKLLESNVLNEILKLPKLEQHIAVGKIQGKDKAFSEALGKKFTELRALFIGSNNLTDNDMLSVKKDAIYTIGQCNSTVFGNIEFVPKNRYTSYLRLVDDVNAEIYYNDIGLDIKRLRENVVNLHRPYMLEFIRKSIKYLESNDSFITRFLKKFINEYKSGKLEDLYYIEMSNTSKEFNPIFNYQNIIVPIVRIAIKEVR